MLCVFHRERPQRYMPPTFAASQFPLSQYYCYWVPATKALWCEIHQSSLFHFNQGTTHQSPVLRLPLVLRQSTLLHHLQVHHSPISSVTPSTRVAPISTVAPSISVAPIVTVALLQLHRPTVLLLLLATILYYVIMLLDDSILSIIWLLM